MKYEGKYRPLFHYLSHSHADQVVLTFADIEWELQAALPASARNTRGLVEQPWPWSRCRPGLMDAGYAASSVDLTTREVVFRKLKRRYEVRRVGDTILWGQRPGARAARSSEASARPSWPKLFCTRQSRLSVNGKPASMPQNSRNIQISHPCLRSGRVSSFRRRGKRSR